MNRSISGLVTNVLFVCLLPCLCLMLDSARSALHVWAQVPPSNNRQGALQVLFELASDFHSADLPRRSSILAVIDERGTASEAEAVFIRAAFGAAPDSGYRRLAVAETEEPYAYIRALRSSYARFRATQMAGDQKWAAKQFKAAQEYAKLVANALIVEAQQDERDATRLQSVPFAVRRSPADQAAFVQSLKTHGLSPEHRRLMQESGRSEPEIAKFQEHLLQLPLDKIGVSPAEMQAQIAATRRELISELNSFAQANPGALAGASAQTFFVGNPHDRQETVDLFIRPISIPPDWKVSIVTAEQSEANRLAAKPSDGQPQFPVRKVEPGKHYAVTLPGKGQVTVASVLVPAGAVGARTTSRWAVEGKIGDELIGGMVHEMNVPYVIADLKLPPVGSKEVEEELVPTPSKAGARTVVEIAVGILVMGMLVFAFIFWHRRRAKLAP